MGQSHAIAFHAALAGLDPIQSFAAAASTDQLDERSKDLRGLAPSNPYSALTLLTHAAEMNGQRLQLSLYTVCTRPKNNKAPEGIRG